MVNFGPTIGAEIKKTRPAVIASNDVANRYSPVVIVAAITGRSQPKYDEVFLQPPEGGVTKPSVILPNQIRTIDKRRLVKNTGKLSPKSTAQLNFSLQLTLGLLDF